MGVSPFRFANRNEKRAQGIRAISQAAHRGRFYYVPIFDIHTSHLSKENANAHIRRVKSFLPTTGKVCIICITDKQFGDIELFYGAKPAAINTPGQQLELF